jgi:NAD-dependent DNA ligase
MNYDPDINPDPTEWISMDDGLKMAFISDYHKSERISLPNLMLHAAIHAVVENQIAMGDATDARSTLDRLIQEGLDRHDAVHAIGSVLAGQIFEIMKNKKEADLVSYSKELKNLTAQKWKKSGQQ